MSSNTGRTVIKIAAPLVILVLSIAATVTLIKSRTKPERTAPENRGVLVSVEKAQTATRTIDVRGQGEVTPARTVVLQPRVQGEVIWVSEKLVEGGVVQKGEPLVKIDRSDYQIAVEQSKTAVASAEAQITLEEGQQKVAKKEWELFKKDVDGNADPGLALRGPQKRIAEVNLKSAESQLKRAQLDLRRTTIRAPFNAYVRSESVEVGQLATMGSPMATLVGTDEFWVQVSIPMDRLGLIDVPGLNATGEGSAAKIVQDLGTGKIEREGKVLRLLGDLDPVGRMARVIVQIDDPANLAKAPEERGLPLLVGAYVSVTIQGGESRNVVALSRRYVHEGDSVHLMKDDKLQIAKAVIVWRDEDEVLIRGGVAEGDEVVVSKISTPVDGMKLRTESTQAEPAKRAEVAK